ncbi:MAG: lipocalin family protein, partial [Planctomycetota bacterium]
AGERTPPRWRDDGDRARYRHPVGNRRGTGAGYLWTLARQPRINDDPYQRLVARAKKLGYDPSLLEKMPRPSGG